MNILKMARAGLRRELTRALHKASVRKELVRCPGLRVKTNGGFAAVNLTIQPVSSGAEPSMLLVIFEEAPPANQEAPSMAADAGEGADAAQDTDARIAALKQELRAKEEYLQTTNEEMETTNEELKSSNEEMQSVNEEMQSINEELETSKEELQSVNEELATVNTELQTKVSDLSRANNDMNNLLAGTGIGTIFVDHQLRILRFTPAVTQVINLILTDVGRPVGHIVSNLTGYDHLVADIQSVLDTLAPRDAEVQTNAGAWCLMRIRPYRTLDNMIEGAVITFVDITERKRLEGLVRLGVVVRDSNDAITMQDLEGHILGWNRGAERMYGWNEAEALTMNIRDIIPEDQREEELAAARQLSRAEVLQPYRARRIAKDGRIVEIWLTATALANEAGEVYAIATTERGTSIAND